MLVSVFLPVIIHSLVMVQENILLQELIALILELRQVIMHVEIKLLQLDIMQDMVVDLKREVFS